MADLIDYLDQLDAERAKLSLYGRRFRKFRWLVPGLVKGLTRELEEEWAQVTAERQRTLEVIWADPVLRVRMKEREEAAIAEARKRMIAREVMSSLPGRPYMVSQPVKEIGIKVVGLEREEARRQNFLDEALFYYGSGAWQNDGIEVGKLTKLMDDLTLDRDRVRLALHRVRDGLHTRVEMETTHKNDPVSMILENVLAGIRTELPVMERDKETPLSRFVEKERPKLETAREPKKVYEPTR